MNAEREGDASPLLPIYCGGCRGLLLIVIVILIELPGRLSDGDATGTVALRYEMQPRSAFAKAAAGQAVALLC
jgi:hypothetical protein